MTIIKVTSEHVQEPPADTYSNCLVVDNQVFMSGQCAFGDNTYEQAKAILENIKNLMESAGGSMADVVKLNVFLTNMDDRDQIAKARCEFFEGDFPVSTMFEISKLVFPQLTVEIEAVGIIGASKA